MSVGKRIATAREVLGLTKGQFAKKMNVSYQTVSDWEEDVITPRPSRFELLSKVLQAPSNWLILGQGKYSPGDPTNDVCVEAFDEDDAKNYNCELENKNQSVSLIEFNRNWLNSNAEFNDDTALATITHQGDNLSPQVTNGDILLIDCSVSEIQTAAIYVVALNGKQYTANCTKQLDNSIVIITDNRMNIPYIIKDTDEFEVIGRVVMRLTPSKV